ncbi:MAG TPA: transketolase [Chitinophagaceae bacterium]|nr:transketolase [Chitinophagaceae bacterium]
MEIKELTNIAAQVRRDCLRMVYEAQSGHPGGSLGCADFFTALYFEIMDRKEGFDMDGKGEDIFFLSNGHISPVWYSALARSGYFPLKELGTYRKIDSRVQGHPATAEHLPGIRIASGSLGQGMSVAIGAATAKKLNKDEHIVYSLHGDGELDEGQNWEAIMYAAMHKVDNLISTVDRNGQQIDGTTEAVMKLANLKEKFLAFNWEVLEMDGNNMEEVITTLQKAKTFTGKGKPIVIVMKTVMGKGVDFMENNHEWHGTAPNADQYKIAIAELPETLGDY